MKRQTSPYNHISVQHLHMRFCFILQEMSKIIPVRIHQIANNSSLLIRYPPKILNHKPFTGDALKPNVAFSGT